MVKKKRKEYKIAINQIDQILLRDLQRVKKSQIVSSGLRSEGVK